MLGLTGYGRMGTLHITTVTPALRGGTMVEYALLIGHNALVSLAGQVNAVAASVNWPLVGAIVGGLLFVRFALKPPRVH
jgi:hypothetical protein